MKRINHKYNPSNLLLVLTPTTAKNSYQRIRFANLLYIIVFSLGNYNANAQNIKTEYDIEIALGKMGWHKKQLFLFMDTTCNIKSTTIGWYDLDLYISDYKELKKGVYYTRKTLYSTDSIRYKLLDSLKFYVEVYDSLKTIKEAGIIVPVGPYKISMEREKQFKSEKPNEFKIKYTHHYFYIRYGKWKFLRKGKYIEKDYNYPNQINLNEIYDDYYEEITKRRKEYIKKNKLKKDYYD